MPHTFIALAFATLLAGQSGTAAEAAAAETTATEVPPTPAARHAAETVRTADADEKVTCRNERAVGSKMITRVCKTAAQRKQDTQQARDTLQNGRGINTLRGD